MAAAGAAGAAGGVGTFLRLGGVQAFLGGLDQVDQKFDNLSKGIAELNPVLGNVTGGFGRFNEQLQGTILAVDNVVTAIGTAASVIATPFQVVGGAIGSAAREIVVADSAIVASLGEVAGAAALFGTGAGLAGVTALTGSLTSLAATAVVESAKYQRGMKDIEGVSQATGPVLVELDTTIRRVATGFSSSIQEIQSAALELNKSGIAVEDFKGKVLDLALATSQVSTGELSPGQASQGIGANLKLFEKDFDRTADIVEERVRRITAGVVGIANATRASPGEIFSGLAKAGPNFAAIDESIEHTTALIGVLVGGGLRGEEAGTSLANFLQRLQAPSREASKILEKRNISLFDADEKARPAIDVIRDLENTYGDAARAVSGMTDAVSNFEKSEIFQTRTLRGVNLILEQTTARYEEYLAKIRETDVLKQAATQNEALIRQLEILRNNAQLAGIAFGKDFVEGLGGGVQALNTWLAAGERAQQVASALGKATASILTGGNRDDARAAVADSPVGDSGGLGMFDTLAAQSDEIRPRIEGVVRAALSLGETVGRLAFPAGLENPINEVGGAIQGVLDGTARFLVELNRLAPEGDRAFRQLITDAGQFKDEMALIFTENDGEGSFERLALAGARTLGVVRAEAGPTIESLARLTRAIEDNGPAFLGVADIGVRAFGLINRAILDATTSAVNFSGSLINAAAKILDLQGQVITLRFVTERPTAPFDNLDRPASLDPRALPGPSSVFRDIEDAENARRQAQLRIPTRDDSRLGPERGAGAIGVVPFDRSVVPFDESALDRIPELAESLESVAAAGAATVGVFPKIGQAEKDAEKAAKDLEAATKSLGGAMRTLDKDVADAERAFDKTIQSAAARWLDGLDQITQATNDAFTTITGDAERSKGRLIEAFNTTTQRAFLNQAFKQGQEEQQRIEAHAQEDRRTLRSQFAEDETRLEGRRQQNAETALNDHHNRLALLRSNDVEDAARTRARSFEDRLTGIGRGNELEVQTIGRGFETAATQRQRSRENVDRQRQLTRALAAETDPTARAGLQTSFNTASQDLARTRSEQDVETRIGRSQQDQLRDVRLKHEEELKRVRRTNDDEELERKRKEATLELGYRIAAEVDLLRFRRLLEDGEVGRRRIVQARELTITRLEELRSRDFSRLQEGDKQQFQFLLERLPDLERGLKEIDEGTTRALTARLQQSLREMNRGGATFRREVDQAQATLAERHIQFGERLANQGEGLRERSAGIAPALAAAEAVLAAQSITSQNRVRGNAEAIKRSIQGVTDAQRDQILSILPALDTVANLFGGDASAAATVVTQLQLSPQVDKLTKALEALTDKIEKIAPGTHIDTVNQAPGDPSSVRIPVAAGV